MQTIDMVINNQVFQVALAENETANAFRALLPMTLHMEELNGNEKYHYLMGDLPTADSCPGSIAAGDIRLFDRRCVVLFYQSFPTDFSYTGIGKVTDPAGLAAAVGTGDIDVTFKESAQ